MILAALGFSLSANASPKVPADLNVVQLLEAFQTHLAHVQMPYVVLNRSIPLVKNGNIPLGDSCSVHALAQSCNVSSSGYYNQILNSTPGDVLKSGKKYNFDSMKLFSDSFSAIFKNEAESMCAIEISCHNQQIKSWTVSHFETHSSNAFELHSFIGKDDHSIVRQVPKAGLDVKNFKGHWANAFFGSGLPGTVGMQLLVGSNLKAFPNPLNAPIVIGKKCSLMSQESDSIGTEYAKDSRYGFLGYKVLQEEHMVELLFGNWSYSPHQIRVKCQGDEKEVFAMNSAKIESDLNGAIQFYSK